MSLAGNTRFLSLLSDRLTFHFRALIVIVYLLVVLSKVASVKKAVCSSGTSGRYTEALSPVGAERGPWGRATCVLTVVRGRYGHLESAIEG